MFALEKYHLTLNHILYRFLNLNSPIKQGGLSIKLRLEMSENPPIIKEAECESDLLLKECNKDMTASGFLDRQTIESECESLDSSRFITPHKAIKSLLYPPKLPMPDLGVEDSFYACLAQHEELERQFKILQIKYEQQLEIQKNYSSSLRNLEEEIKSATIRNNELTVQNFKLTNEISRLLEINKNNEEYQGRLSLCIEKLEATNNFLQEKKIIENERPMTNYFLKFYSRIQDISIILSRFSFQLYENLEAVSTMLLLKENHIEELKLSLAKLINKRTQRRYISTTNANLFDENRQNIEISCNQMLNRRLQMQGSNTKFEKTESPLDASLLENECANISILDQGSSIDLTAAPIKKYSYMKNSPIKEFSFRNLGIKDKCFLTKGIDKSTTCNKILPRNRFDYALADSELNRKYLSALILLLQHHADSLSFIKQVLANEEYYKSNTSYLLIPVSLFFLFTSLILIFT